MKKEQLKQLESDLWSAANNLRANSDLKSSEYAIPVLGLIFLKFADNNYRRHEAEILAEYQKLKGTRREKKISDIAVEKCGFYLPDHARYDWLLNLPEEKDIAKALKEAMKAIEEYKPELEGVLPKDDYWGFLKKLRLARIASFTAAPIAHLHRPLFFASRALNEGRSITMR
jgi:type I restriction enzyme M protein